MSGMNIRGNVPPGQKLTGGRANRRRVTRKNRRVNRKTRRANRKSRRGGSRA